MDSVRGNQTLSGTWSEVWMNGDKVFETKKINAKIGVNREDVQLGVDVDSKMTGLKGEGSLTIAKVFSRYEDIRQSYSRGEDVRSQIITKLADPDTIGKQQERYSIDNVWFNDLPIINYEKGAVIEEELPFGFTPSDMVNLDRINK